MTGDEAMLLMERIRREGGTVTNKLSHADGRQVLIAIVNGEGRRIESIAAYEFLMRGRRHERPVFGEAVPGLEHRTKAREGQMMFGEGS